MSYAEGLVFHEAPTEETSASQWNISFEAFDIQGMIIIKQLIIFILYFEYSN